MEFLQKKLKGKSLNLTRSQRSLLEYILAHEEESVFLNVGDLAKKGGVSEATVVRLAKALDFKGFPQFQKQLRDLFRDKLTTTSRLQRTANRISQEGDVLIKVMQTDVENISATLKQVPLPDFNLLVNSLASAERIVLVGLRSVHSLAIFMGVALEFLQKNVWVLQPGVGDLWDRLLGLRKGDLVLAISFPRYTRQTVEILRFAKERGIETAAITDSLLSPLVQYADHILTARCRMDSFIESFTAPLSLINAIVTSLGIRDRQKTMQSLETLEEVWRTRQVYFNPASRRERALFPKPVMTVRGSKKLRKKEGV